MLSKKMSNNKKNLKPHLYFVNFDCKILKKHLCDTKTYIPISFYTLMVHAVVCAIARYDTVGDILRVR